MSLVWSPCGPTLVVETVNPLRVECKVCGVPRSAQCVSRTRRRRTIDPHPARIEAARALLNPTDTEEPGESDDRTD